MNDNNFFSVDRLVEFGMGMAMAQQMVNMMNQSMKQMYVPGSIQSMPQPRPQQSNIIYVGIEGKQVGPLNESEIITLVGSTKTPWHGCRECLRGNPSSKCPRF